MKNWEPKSPEPSYLLEWNWDKLLEENWLVPNCTQNRFSFNYPFVKVLEQSVTLEEHSQKMYSSLTEILSGIDNISSVEFVDSTNG